MARVLIGDKWYEGVSSHSWNESDFERVVLDHSDRLFPGWQCVPFAEKIMDDGGVAKKPDLALIDPEYRTWWVVEVELAHHSLTGHVLPQVEVFRHGTYLARHASVLAVAAPDLDAHRLRAMVLGEPPGILVVVDSPATSWRGPLKDLGVRLAIAEPFRDPHGTLLLRLNGDQPVAPAEVLTRCSRIPTMRRLWKVHSPAALPGSESVDIDWNGSLSRWNVVRLAGGVALQSARGDVLAEYSAVDVIQEPDGRLAFRAVQKRRSGT